MEVNLFNIQRMSLHDGPGIRTTIFFQGCNLRCAWCHNPESFESGRQIQWNQSSCISCGACTRACQAGARYLRGEKLVYERSLCRGCGGCARVCMAGAVRQVGFTIDTGQVLQEVLKDKALYEISGGGVTCSGGEPLLQAEGAACLLEGLKSAGIHTAVDTAGNVPFENFEKVIPFTNVFLYDLKLWDSGMHQRYTGVSNERILENFEKLERISQIIVRIPFIGEIQESAVKPLACFLRGRKNVKMIELLPYHRLGEGKYAELGKKNAAFTAPSREVLEKAANDFKEQGASVRISG